MKKFSMEVGGNRPQTITDWSEMIAEQCGIADEYIVEMLRAWLGMFYKFAIKDTNYSMLRPRPTTKTTGTSKRKPVKK